MEKVLIEVDDNLIRGQNKWKECLWKLDNDNSCWRNKIKTRQNQKRIQESQVKFKTLDSKFKNLQKRNLEVSGWEQTVEECWKSMDTRFI